jgi:hypothetical protein
MALSDKSGIFSRLLRGATDSFASQSNGAVASSLSTALPDATGRAAFVAPERAGTTPTAIAADLAQILARQKDAEIEGRPGPHPAETPVKASEKPVTLDDVLREFRSGDLMPLRLGRVAYLYVRDQPHRPQALRDLKGALCADDQVTAAGRVDRYLAIYWVARLFGWKDAQRLRVAAIRELRGLIARNAATEEWQIRKGLDEPARALWMRMLNERLPAHVVRLEVLKILPPRKASLKMHGRGGRVAKTFKEVGRWNREADLVEMLRVVQDRLAAIRPAVAVGAGPEAA